jgi:probable selenium-dependent hydroxylase accessory protein YqeC
VNIPVLDYLDIAAGSVIAVVGCGGKTSFIEYAADRLRDKKTLVSTTTKMFPMKTRGVVVCETLQRCNEHMPRTGIQCLGLLNAATGKLEPLPDYILAGLVPRYDVTLLEADGSRGLPCKGWLANEPAVPPYCTHTVGIVTMSVLGKAATEAVVHRLPEFLSLTGLKEGQPVTERALEAMICAPDGMFKCSAGRRYLLINQVEDDASAAAALSFLRMIKEKHPRQCVKMLYGSIHIDAWQDV